jgi:thioester reductase-like protein
MCTGSGYIQSKYVAEKIVRVAASRGLPAAIYRPWLVGGHTQTGVSHVTDYVLLMLKAVLDLGIAPEHEETVELTPIDFFAPAFVHIARQETSPGRVFHFANPQPVQVGVIFEWIRSYGYDVELLPYAEWRAKLLRRLQAPHRSYSILPLIPESERPYGRRHPRIDCTNTFAALEGSGLSCPPIDERLVHTYLAYLVEVGFLEPPSRRPEEAKIGVQAQGGPTR